MSKRDNIEIEKEDLRKRGVDLSWLHLESTRIADKIMGQYPNSWQKELMKMYTYVAITELVKEKQDERKKKNQGA